ncbi:MAG: hypothetical protein ABW069_04545 [Duganella sp.]
MTVTPSASGFSTHHTTEVEIDEIGILPGASVLTFIFSGSNDVRHVFSQTSEIDLERVAAALYWRPGNPGGLLFALLFALLDTRVRAAAGRAVCTGRAVAAKATANVEWISIGLPVAG